MLAFRPYRTSTRPSTPTTPSPSNTASAGAFDLDHVPGDVVIRHAHGTESFTPLGAPDTVENPKPRSTPPVTATFFDHSRGTPDLADPAE